MKNKSVGILSLILSLILVFSIMPLAASAQETDNASSDASADIPQETIAAEADEVIEKDEADLAAVGAEADAAETGLLKTPKINCHETLSNGIRLLWNAVPGAEKYRVFYKKNGVWTKLADTAENDWYDSGLNVSGATRTYTLRCINAAGTAFTSDYDRTGYTLTYNLNTPEISYCESVDAGVRIKWEYIYYAKKYRVYRKGSKGWTRIGDTTESSIIDTDVTSYGSYVYTVRCISKDATRFTSDFDRNGYRFTYNMATPKITGFTSLANGVRIKISPVTNCMKYRVFYKNNGYWTSLGDTKSNSFIHENAVFGKTYTYTVRCIKDDSSRFTSGFNGVGWNYTHYLSTPQITGFEDTEQGTSIRWSEVPYADKYRVYCKKNGYWTRLGDTTATSFTDNTAQIGESRTYTIRCLNYAANTFTSYYNANGWNHTRYVETPCLHRIAAVSNGIRLEWRLIPNAAKYRIYIKQNGSWTKIGESSGDYFIYTGAKLNTTYTFTIRCVNAAGNAFTSDFIRDGWTFYNRANALDVYPIISGAKWNNDGYMTLDIYDISTAVRYRIYVKAGSTWKELKTIPVKGHISAEDFTNAGVDAPAAGSRYTLTALGIDKYGNPATEVFTFGYSVKVR